MAPPHGIIAWLNNTYPKPRVDPEWLDACYEYVISSLDPDTDIETIKSNIEKQLLGSDLSDSMLPGTGLPSNISTLNNTHLPARPPILVQIISITDVGNSAFSLQNTRQTRLDRADLAGLGAEAEEAEEDEGPVPKYPRSILKMELSDGAISVKAMEYRRLSDLVLGETPLGYKMLLKDVFMRRGIAFLEPKCVELIGHQSEERMAAQDSDFVKGLRIRLGQDPEPHPENNPGPPPLGNVVAAGSAIPQALPPRTSPAPARAPFSELPGPPEPPVAGPSGTHHDDDEDQPRRRRIPNPGGPPVVQSSYFSASPAHPPTGLTQTRLFSPRRVADATLLEQNAEHPLVLDQNSDFGDDSMVMDAAMAEQIDLIEQQAVVASQTEASRPRGNADLVGVPSSSCASASGSGSASGSSMPSAGPTRSQEFSEPMTVITISDDDEDDKENVPVPTRHVRRRTARPTIQVGDVIDISD